MQRARSRCVEIGFAKSTRLTGLDWRFRRLSADGGLDFGNANIWAFDPTLDIFAREVTQNSVDVGIDDSVDLTFRLHRLTGDRLARFLDAILWDELGEHLRAAADPSQKFGRTLQRGLARLAEDDQLDVLVVEERGARGLIGAERGKGSNFAALCRNNLDSQKSAVAGGAFGLGKAVLWRMSSLSTVLFHSNLTEAVDGDPERRLGRLFGRSELAYHEVDRDPFAGPGWFGAPDDQGSVGSAWGHQDAAGALLMPRSPDMLGTSINVLGFHDPSADEDAPLEASARRLVTAIATHFWPAIELGHLTAHVEIDDGDGDVSSLPVTARLVVPEYVDLLRHHRVDDVTPSLDEPRDVARRVVPLHVPGRIGEHDEFQHESILVVRRADPNADDGAPPNRVAFVRGARMVVEYRSFGSVGVGARPFHATVLCGLAADHDLPDEIDDSDADRLAAEEFLRLAEPPSHTTWELTPDVKALYAYGAGARLRDFRAAVKTAVRELVTPAVGEASDGPRDLKNLLRIAPVTDSQRRPYILGNEVRVDEAGRWVVRATLHAPPPAGKTWSGRPVVVFHAETGAGRAVALESLTALDNCDVVDGRLKVTLGKKQATFEMRTDPSSHPVDAHESSVTLQFRAAELRSV